MNMNNKEKHIKFSKKSIEYSKLLPVITLVVFIFCLFQGFLADYSTVVDVSFYVTATTISGTAFVTSIVFYYRKAQSENSIKLKTSLYKVSSEMRLHYNEEMMKLKKQYEMTNEDIESIELDSYMDDFEQQAFDSMITTVDKVQEEADTTIEIPTF